MKGANVVIMKYPVAIHKEANSVYGVSVPDIEGCFSFGDTLEEAMSNTREAICNHLEILAEDGFLAPEARPFDDYVNAPNSLSAHWAYVDVDISVLSPKAKVPSLDERLALSPDSAFDFSSEDVQWLNEPSICDDHKTVLTTRQNGRPAAVMRLEDFHAYEETANLMASPKNASRLSQAIAEIEARHIKKE